MHRANSQNDGVRLRLRLTNYMRNILSLASDARRILLHGGDKGNPIPSLRIAISLQNEISGLAPLSSARIVGRHLRMQQRWPGPPGCCGAASSHHSGPVQLVSSACFQILFESRKAIR